MLPAFALLHTPSRIRPHRFFPRPPDMVIADTEVIAAAPVRFLVAGMGDAMATFYEARACQNNPQACSLIAPLTYRPPRVAMAIAAACLEVLFCHGVRAKEDCEQRKLSEAVDAVRRRGANRAFSQRCRKSC